METTLTGREATQALQLYSALGAKRASFDGRKVANAIKSVAGRARLSAAIQLSKPLPVPGACYLPRSTSRSTASPKGRRSRVASRKAPDLPRPARGLEAATEALGASHDA